MQVVLFENNIEKGPQVEAEGDRQQEHSGIDYCRVRLRLTCSARDGALPASACRWSPRRLAGIIPFHIPPGTESDRCVMRVRVVATVVLVILMS